MATGMVLTVAQTLFAALDSSVLKEICSMFGYASDLEELKGTVSTVRAVLLDAEAKQVELSNEAQDWIDKLKYTVYDVDDLLDEFNTTAQQRKHKASGKNRVYQKVRQLFSRTNQFRFALRASVEIKKIKKKLDAIASDHSKFGLGVEGQSSCLAREETCSYVYEERIIGRDGDKEKLVSMLLNSSAEHDVSFVTIIGVGGVGKTALAQLVYNDDRIKSEFQLKLWVCVSQEFGVKEILRKMLKSLSADEMYDDLVLDQLQSKVRQHIETQRYLLVLDDVWEERREAWVKLNDFLVRGKRGSKVLVTSRSRNVARAIGDYPWHELQGLAEEDAWRLFTLMAFGKEEQYLDANLVEIGKDIVKKCASVPLSIRVIGSLLYGHGIDRWLLIQKKDVAKIEEAKDSMMAILKFSYYHLTPSLKSCFSYCALFPKDHVIKKDLLIDLWMANGCIVPQCEGQSIEDVGEEYFLVLLHRCFFQETTKDHSGGIISCKVHDLMHDLALEIAGHELKILSSGTGHLDKRVRHLSIVERCPIFDSSYNFSANMKMRTFLQISLEHFGQANVTKILQNCGRLRWLDLRGVSLRTLPSGIGRLIHLRCLDLSHNNELERLPESITSLHNLQILKLESCRKLQALPKDVERLVNLRELDINGCYALSCMPSGLQNLSCLHRLTTFVVSGNSEEVQMSQLEDLKALVNLRGELTIRTVKCCSNEISKITGAYLLNKPDPRHGDVQEAQLEGFQAHWSLISMRMVEYNGAKLASWLLGENTMRALFPHLVSVTLEGLARIEQIPFLSQLCHLKELYIGYVPNLEYIESRSSDATLADSTFFPSLEVLRLFFLPSLKRWWRDGVMMGVTGHGSGIGYGKTREQDGTNGYQMSSLFLFPRLRELAIYSCPNMESFPPCPLLKVLRLSHLDEVPLFLEKRGRVENVIQGNDLCEMASSSSNVGVASRDGDSCRVTPPVFALEELLIHETGPARRKSDVFGNWDRMTIYRETLMSRLPKKSVRSLARIKIETFDESLSRLRDVFRSSASSLRSLEISFSNNLKSLSGGGMEYLSSLQSLEIRYAEELELEDEDEPWKFLHSLSSLKLVELPKMVKLPKGLQYLTALRSLTIESCHSLIALPRWFSSLESLRSLTIEWCPCLTSSEAMRYLPSHTNLTFRKYPF